jgi:SHS2 domain-containing protein
MGRLRFRTIDHTADIGLLVWGDSREALFENAAAGLFHLLYPGMRGGGRLGRRHEWELSERNLEELLVEWLRRLLYLHQDEGLFLSDFKVDLGGGPRLSAGCLGRPADRSGGQYDIKLVTYHGLEIEMVDGRFRVRVIFDI